MIRFSTGIEHHEDILKDLEQALEWCERYPDRNPANQARTFFTTPWNAGNANRAPKSDCRERLYKAGTLTYIIPQNIRRLNEMRS